MIRGLTFVVISSLGWAFVVIGLLGDLPWPSLLVGLVRKRAGQMEFIRKRVKGKIRLIWERSGVVGLEGKSG